MIIISQNVNIFMEVKGNEIKRNKKKIKYVTIRISQQIKHIAKYNKQL